MASAEKLRKLQILLNELDPEDLDSLLSQIEKKDKEDPIKTASGSKINKTQRPNKFLDMKFSTKEKHQLKEDGEIDKILLKGVELSSRDREPAGLIEVKCSVCNKTERVSAVLVHSVERYRCNTCFQG